MGITKLDHEVSPSPWPAFARTSQHRPPRQCMHGAEQWRPLVAVVSALLSSSQAVASSIFSASLQLCSCGTEARPDRKAGRCRDWNEGLSCSACHR